MNVFVTGGTGYVGAPIVRQLVRSGYKVTVLSRNGHEDRRLANAQVDVVIGDIFDDTALHLGMEHADAVVHLVGIIEEHPRQGITMNRIHVDGTTHVLEAARRFQVRRFIHMSALGARSDAKSNYHRSKWEAEKHVRQSGLPFTIFRPSVVYGVGGPGPHFVQQLADLVRQSPVIPIVGHGNYQLQPVHVDVVAQVFTAALHMDTVIGETFEVGGANVVTYGEIMHSIMKILNVHKPSLKIPLVLLETAIRTLGWTNQIPLTMDQLLMLKEGNVCTNTMRLYDVFALPAIQFALQENMLTAN